VTVSVGDGGIAAVSVTGAHPLLPGEKLQLTATALDGNNQPMSAVFAWSTDNPSIAIVDPAGVVIALDYGTTTVSATGFHNGYAGPPGNGDIQVGAQVANLTIAPAAVSALVGATVQFTATALDANGAVLPAIFVWDTLDHSVALIDNQSGVATAVAPGQTTILVFVIGPPMVLPSGTAGTKITVTR
jgi:hypothetical protein